MTEALRFQQGVNASRLTTLRVGGEVPLLVTANTPAALEPALRTLDDGPTWLMLGAGSNLLVGDTGVPPILRLGEGFRRSWTRGNTLICGGALSGATALRAAAAAGLSGLEPFGGMPGTVGGWAATNAGPSGCDTLERVDWVTARPRSGGAPVRFAASEICRGYRTSPFRGEWIVEEVAFGLAPGPSCAIRRATRRARDQRMSSQPAGASAGCVFRNPQKAPAGKMIDRSGLKGSSVGPITVSRQHANFIMNQGGGTATQVWRLIQRLRRDVEARFGVPLQLEIERFGSFAGA